ncbi:hypothetical protein F5146DRAFT_654062 [Armillaria mellea]|nr:hypothetical protein F5146DRAFT_654062 [Armillaria mellea]
MGTKKSTVWLLLARVSGFTSAYSGARHRGLLHIVHSSMHGWVSPSLELHTHAIKTHGRTEGTHDRGWNSGNGPDSLPKATRSSNFDCHSRICNILTDDHIAMCCCHL